MKSLLLFVSFILTLQNASARKSNIFLRTNLDWLDDDDLNRHGNSKELYDAINPPPTKRPSYLPTSMPTSMPTSIPTSMPTSRPTSMPSKAFCKSSDDGGFGNINGANMEIVSFRYEVQVNKTNMTSHPDNHADETENEIIPLVEELLLELLLGDLFDECSNGNKTSNSTDIFSSIEGASSQPKDQMDNEGKTPQIASIGLIAQNFSFLLISP